MKKTNPLDKIKIASPCAANWEEMIGDERARHCSECRLNVYNLSEMSRREAENFLIKAEGRICVKFYRRSDGTVLTRDCPVGWKVIKRRTTHAISALFSMCFGIISGFSAFQITEFDTSSLINEVVVESIEPETANNSVPVVGEVELKAVKPEKTKIKKSRSQMVLGRLETIRRLEDESVKLWIK